MQYGRSMLRGYDKETAKHIASALHIPMKGGGNHRMKIPMSALKKDPANKPKDKKKAAGMKFGMMKGKKSDNDADDK